MLGNDTVEVQVGKYKGTLFQFGSVSIKEDKESDRLRLKFDYNIESSPVEVDHEEFLQVAGDILANIIGQGEIKKV